MERPEQSLAFVLGLDLGQASDYTALVVNQRVKVITSMRAAAVTVGPGGIGMQGDRIEGYEEHRFRHIQRYPLKTPYPTIVTQVGGVIDALKPQGRVLLIVDHTGVGRPVVDLFRLAGYGVSVYAVTITGGQQAKRDPDRAWDWTVPKKDLVGALQSQFHQERIKIARALPEAKALLDELQNFRMKMTAAANLTFEAWRDGDHDDLVLASALAVWGADRFAARGGLA